MSNHEWGKLADWIHEHLSEAHRGVFRLGDYIIVFSHDRLDSEAGNRLHLRIESWLADQDLIVERFEESTVGTTWFMAVRPKPTLEMIEDALWNAWAEAKGGDVNDPSFKMLAIAQRAIPHRVLGGATPPP